MHRLLALVFLAVLPASAQTKWFKGNTHTHTLWSDGNDFAEMVIDWYKQRGYDFLALSDHNILQAKEVWMDVKAVEKRRKALGKTTMEKYRARFGDDWVITREKEGSTEVRLREMREYAPKFDEPGKFLLVKAEEISASFQNAPIHMNAVNVQEEIQPVKDLTSIQETMRANLKLVAEQSKRLGVPIFTHINHPNFRMALTADDLAAVTEENFFEIYNGHPMILWQGDEFRDSHEKIWDIANTLRLTQFKAAPLFGVGTDDSHHYHGEESSPGRGWVMVRAEKLEANALTEAMKRGDFYASSGVTLGLETVDGTDFDGATNPKPTYDGWTNAGTPWLRTTAPVAPNQTLKIRFVVWDSGVVQGQGDHNLDSMVTIDRFRWRAVDVQAETAPE